MIEREISIIKQMFLTVTEADGSHAEFVLQSALLSCDSPLRCQHSPQGPTLPL